MKPKTLKKELSNLNYCLNVAKNKWIFSNIRTVSGISEFFGITSNDNNPITLKEVEILKQKLEQQIKDKYANSITSDGTIQSQVPDTISQTDQTNPELQVEIFAPDSTKTETYPESTYQEKYPDQEASLLITHCNQVKAAKQLWDRISLQHFKGQLLLAQTGAGKTYILGSMLKNFIEQGWIKKLDCISPWPILYVTKATVVEQTKKVLRDEFGIDTVNTVHVINIELLRSSLGTVFVRNDIQIINGTEHEVWSWRPFGHPCLIVWDECQILAREEATQSKIAHGVNRISELYNNNPKEVFQIFSSATPFSRVIESRCFAISTGVEFGFGVGMLKLTEHTWRQFAAVIASPAKPEEYVEAAAKRLIEVLEPYITRIKGIRPAFKTYNSISKIHFQSAAEAEEYHQALEKYEKEKRRIEGESGLSDSQSSFALLAQFTIFRKAAEKVRRQHLARFAYDSWSAGKAPAIACAFKGTITAVYRILVEDYGWNRGDVSLIWGGSTETLSAKKKIAKKVRENTELLKALEESDIDLVDDLGLEDYEEKTEEQLAFERLHDLLTQKPEDRERERINFQKQKSKLLMFTFKAGGVGLSAHHEAKYPNARPREGIFSPVYSEKELIQALGRLPRITSISDTFQTMCYYGGTIEEHVAVRVAMKLKCMKEVVRAKESWEDIIVGRKVITNQLEENIMNAVDEVEVGNLLGEYKE